ncbi:MULTISPECIES: S1 RNA-binding domain-containing protein [Ruminococcus]|jgi:S1 RNA binding domain protein|uniref:S1 RNA binding domain protein n=1 Tax=Ruminococcus flavefaciens TaxID=1265 RepID=A0A315XX95_RUMFL|nr:MULTISPECIES: S1 RNA-binding domain-containing protein [Ruminococcus]MBQ6170171.1 S1 RNA-binding domain-containing protein [Ruminococcus sp.]MBR1430828.1 S1 RNA-binding domain-containing protein [Ruminococcus sp.]PWJ11653.1 S1 RNA binding domain protein [Ruminococcus flavefaciens]SSA50562.1 S1 RNA binding domain protein [Ruminococcus flavefaciens]
MQLEIGKIYNGKVKGITQYGAFVDIDGGGTGMVHISEIANTYVSDIREHLTEEQEVQVKVIGINEQGKVSLSIKKVSDNGDSQPRQRRFDKGQGRPDRSFDKGGDRGERGDRSADRGDRGAERGDRGDKGGDRSERRSKPNIWEPKKQIPQSEMTFEDMMSRFKQTSEERMCDLKRSTDRKNGTRRK